MSDRQALQAKLKAAAWAIAAELGTNAAEEALERVKQEIRNEAWSRP